MSLPAGTRLGQYEVLTGLGAGGMGEVYRARDTRLGRDVALKTLPESFARDPERVARFRREAQILAALNHPHIASLYGVEEVERHHLLVLELVEGQTLAERLRHGALPVDEAVAIAREIAAAVEAAHERGIVHRDLKPGNIALTTDGTVKVLDFGLARVTDERSGAPQPDLMDSPTITSPLALTALGVILGTAAYMSPEQARGAVADKRSDVWAFGCVLYEMLTGRRAFPGDDVTDTLAAVVRAEPDWSRLAASVSPGIRALLEGCLEKDRRKRIADLSTARFVLDRGPALAARVVEKPPAHQARRSFVFVVAAALLGAAAAAVLMRQPAAEPIVTRFTIQLPQGQELAQGRRALTISPDGRRIVYAAGNQLFVRSISEFEAQPLAGADSAMQPAFSADGQSLVFWADGVLKRLALAGGLPVALSEVGPAPYTINWNEDGILVAEPSKGISRVSASGGTPETLVPFVAVDGLSQGAALLPDGDTLLFGQSGTVAAAPSNFWDSGRIVAQSLKTGDRTVLIERGSSPRYLPTGHLLYMVEGTVMAVAFDPSKKKVLGGPAPVVAGVRRTPPAAGGEGQFDVSASGTLAYLPGPARAGQETIFIYGADGSAEALKLGPGTYSHPRVSPDGQWLAFEAHDGKESWISIYHLSGRTAAQRLTFGGNNRFPTWTGDGKRVAFQSDREGDLALFWQPVNGGPAERLTRPGAGTAHVPESWSRHENVLLFRVSKDSTHALWILALPERKASPFGVTSELFPTNAIFRPDGRWIAYQAGDGGTGEAITYVQPFPATGAQYQIARGGRPLWSEDGKRLFFVPAPEQFLGVSVTAGDTFAFTTPEPLPRKFGLAPPADPRSYDVLPDGRIVGINAPPERGATAASQIRVVQNWFEELKAKVPVPR